MKSEGWLSVLMIPFKGTMEEPPVAVDPTRYLVTTIRHRYVGKIIFQDNYMLKLMEESTGKAVKILKENIQGIEILKPGEERQKLN